MLSWTLTELPSHARGSRVRLAGALDAAADANLPLLLAQLGRPSEPLVVEVFGLERLGAAGLRALAREEHHRAAGGGSVTLEGASDAIRRELARSGLLHLLLPPEALRASGAA